ncbi:hypothetical protein FisN_13Lh256 [Fistulifera solaris]|uniref:Uncharacterized protein n=1 Tax=Fistulifera solaris TaxID=1519565 RepID=A0A1Z5KM95_FISSO|nr:hypothetical protein FisN_13Lh256 [Fistulifera solaris]|eukprot:GAX27192.1 hypothetical protein FisN_13Lh256 [Fistulifera solaris]
MMSPPKGGAPLPFPVTYSVGRHDLSFDGSENTNLFVEELLHKTESQIPVSQPNSREARLLTTRRRLSLGTTCDDAEATMRSTSRHSLFPPIFPGSYKHVSILSQYDAVKELKPEDQPKEWWKMLYGDDTTHIRTIIPRSAPSKSCLSSVKKKDRIPNRTPHSVAASVLSDRYDEANTPLEKSVRCVKFGSASAAEFEKDDPPQGSLTPMPPTKAAERYPTEFKELDTDTAELIAMTKENSATLAEWDFFDAGDDDCVDDLAFQSPSERIRRSRRESGRFIPFCEMDACAINYERKVLTDDAETHDVASVEMDVGKTLDVDVDQPMANSSIGDDILVALSSTAAQLFTNLAMSIRVDDTQDCVQSYQSIVNVFASDIIASSDATCHAKIEECLDLTLQSIVDPHLSILQTKSVQYQLKSNTILSAMITARANMQFVSAFTHALESINFDELLTRINAQTKRVDKAILRLEKASQRHLVQIIAERGKLIKSLEEQLLAAQITRETLRSQSLKKQLSCKARSPLTYYVQNYISPFQLMDSSGNEIILQFCSAIEHVRLLLTADFRGESFSIKPSGYVDSCINLKNDGVITMVDVVLSATCAELESDLSALSLPFAVFRVAQVLHRFDLFFERVTSLAGSCEDLSVAQDGSILSVTLHLPNMRSVTLVYTLSGHLLLDPVLLRPELTFDYEADPNTNIFPPLSRFLDVSLP